MSPKSPMADPLVMESPLSPERPAEPAPRHVRFVSCLSRLTTSKGNTNINAVGINTTAAAVGKNNTTTNDIGVIGGK